MHYLFYKARWYIGVALLLCLAITVMKYSAWIDRKFFGSSRQAAPASQQTTSGGANTSITSPQLSATPTSPSDVRNQLIQAQSLLRKASDHTSTALEHSFNWESHVGSLDEQEI